MTIEYCTAVSRETAIQTLAKQAATKTLQSSAWVGIEIPHLSPLREYGGVLGFRSLVLAFGDMHRLEDLPFDEYWRFEAPPHPGPLPSALDAEKIVSFVRQLDEDEKKWTLHVHCEGGISRSSAIAEFVRAVCHVAQPVEHPRWMPNRTLTKLLRQEFRKSPW